MTSVDSPTPRRPWQFGLRAAMLLVLLVAIVLAVASLKLRQDARIQNALTSLNRLGLTQSVSSAGLKLECREPQLSDEAVQELILQLQEIGHRHDLGLSPGLRVESIRLCGAKVSSEALAKLRRAFPATQVDE
jgi:hypothetical protein